MRVHEPRWLPLKLSSLSTRQAAPQLLRAVQLVINASVLTASHGQAQLPRCTRLTGLQYKSDLQELEDRGGLLCELLGERNETIDELHMDIRDMKACLMPWSLLRTICNDWKHALWMQAIFHDQLEALVQRCNALEGAQQEIYTVSAHADGKGGLE